MKMEYDANEKYPHGSWRCSVCGSRFYGGGKAIHKDGCTEKGYGNCVRVVGDELITVVTEYAKIAGSDRSHPVSNISLQDLREGLPEKFT